MHVLISDDGVHRLPELRRIREALQQGGVLPENTFIAVPESDTSGAGGFLRVSTRIPYRLARDYRELVVEGYPVEALYFLWQYGQDTGDTVARVIAVNAGLNVGTDIFNSASTMTVLQAWWLGIPGVCVSAERLSELVQSGCEILLKQPIRDLLVSGNSAFLVNIPTDATGVTNVGAMSYVHRVTNVDIRSRRLYESAGTFCIRDYSVAYTTPVDTDGRAILIDRSAAIVDLNKVLLWKFRNAVRRTEG